MTDTATVPSRERFGRLPSALVKQTQWTRLGDVPALIVDARPWAAGNAPPPMLLWMHGRTVQKELDPGRYLRLMRAGIGVCAVDLPGHGERYDSDLQQPERTFDVVRQMIEEIDGVVDALADHAEVLDPGRIAIGGMSAGGMATLARLCRPHDFLGTCVEATTGSWAHQRDRKMFQDVTATEIARWDPIENLDHWRPIPVQAIHTKADEWVAFAGQEAFLETLRKRYAARGVSVAEMIEFVVFDRTGAPYEHAGFGRKAAEAKDRQTMFLTRVLAPGNPADAT